MYPLVESWPRRGGGGGGGGGGGEGEGCMYSHPFKPDHFEILICLSDCGSLHPFSDGLEEEERSFHGSMSQVRESAAN
jgi:hypothetical protein